MSPNSNYEDGLDPDYSYAMVNGTCLAPPVGCLVSHTLPGDRCSRCIAPGYVLLRNGTCMEVGPLVQPCLAARVFVCNASCQSLACCIRYGMDVQAAAITASLLNR